MKHAMILVIKYCVKINFAIQKRSLNFDIISIVNSIIKGDKHSYSSQTCLECCHPCHVLHNILGVF